MTARLFEPIALRGLTLPNRVVVAPMCQYQADAQGRAGDWHLAHWTQGLVGAAGLMMIEATGVTPEGRITGACLGLWDDENEAAMTQVLARARRLQDGPVALQLGHAGRKASQSAPWLGRSHVPAEEGGWQVLGPSPMAFAEGWSTPEGMTEAELAGLVEAFAQAARRGVRAGVDAIEIHAAHGYLLSSFLSPLANARTDAWGGSAANRRRIVMEIFEAVRAAIPDAMPLGIRVNGSDWAEGGITLEETVELAKALAGVGCDFIDVSSGGNAPARIPVGPGYQLGFAAEIRRASGLATMAVGMIRSPLHAEAALATGQADMIAIGRGFLNDPRWVWHAAEELGVPLAVTNSYAFGATSAYRATPGR